MSASTQAPKVDPRAVRPHMVRLGLAVKLAQGLITLGDFKTLLVPVDHSPLPAGAFDAEHVARMEPAMMQHLSTSAQNAARDDVLHAKARPGSKPTMAASVGVTQAGQHAFDSPSRSYDLAAQRSLTLAIQEKMQGDSSAAATAGPAWQSALRNAAASRRGVVASPIGRPSGPPAPGSGGLIAKMTMKQTWSPAMRPLNNPKNSYAATGGSSNSPAGGASSPGSPLKSGGESVFGFSSSNVASAANASELLPATSPLRASGNGAATVRLRGNMTPTANAFEPALSVTSPSATLRPTTAPPGEVNYDLNDARNPMAALTFKQLDTETGTWSPKQFRSKAGTQLAHLPQTLTDTAIAQGDLQAARTHDRLLKASIHSPQPHSQTMLAAMAAGGATLVLKGSAPSGMSNTAYLAAYGPRPLAAGYSPSRLVPSKEERIIVTAADPRYVPGTTSGPRISPHPEQGPPEGSTPSSPLMSASRRPATAAMASSGNSPGRFGMTMPTSPLQSTATSFYGSFSLRPSTAPAGGDKAAQLLATYSSMQSDAAASVVVSKAAQAQRRETQRRTAEMEAARAHQAMLHVQCAV